MADRGPFAANQEVTPAGTWIGGVRGKIVIKSHKKVLGTFFGLSGTAARPERAPQPQP
jgi:hypothetical protein